MKCRCTYAWNLARVNSTTVRVSQSTSCTDRIYIHEDGAAGAYRDESRSVGRPKPSKCFHHGRQRRVRSLAMLQSAYTMHYETERVAFPSDRCECEELALNRDISLLTGKIYHRSTTLDGGLVRAPTRFAELRFERFSKYWKTHPPYHHYSSWLDSILLLLLYTFNSWNTEFGSTQTRLIILSQMFKLKKYARYIHPFIVADNSSMFCNTLFIYQYNCYQRNCKIVQRNGFFCHSLIKERKVSKVVPIVYDCYEHGI